MTLQEIYNKVGAHLLEQNAKAVDENGRCKYQVGGKMCAVGCLISEDVYSQHSARIEGLAVTSPRVRDALIQSCALNPKTKLSAEELKLLRSLQMMHDKDPPADWPELLNRIALAYKLEPIGALRTIT